MLTDGKGIDILDGYICLQLGTEMWCDHCKLVKNKGVSDKRTYNNHHRVISNKLTYYNHYSVILINVPTTITTGLSRIRCSSFCLTAYTGRNSLCSFNVLFKLNSVLPPSWST